MPTFLFRCPNTGLRVQGYSPEQTADAGDDHLDEYLPVTCHACSRVHLVSPATGKVVGDE